jgi:HD-like signal output (HDOD) protein
VEDFHRPFPNADLLLDRVMEICPFPATAQRLMALVDDERSSLDAIGTANSAFFRKVGSEPTRELRHALVLIGLQELRTMAGAMALLATFATPDEVSLDLQRASAISGSIAATSAPQFSGTARSLPFVCGLLSEVGALACLAVDGRTYFALWQHTVGAHRTSPVEGAKAREDSELRRYRAPARSIGARLLRRHRLPDEIRAAVEAQPELGPNAPLVHRSTAFARMATPLLTGPPVDRREFDQCIAEIARVTSLDGFAPADLSRRAIDAAVHAERALRSSRAT